jgi:moderate conductance mechanosensitive channel
MLRWKRRHDRRGRCATVDVILSLPKNMMSSPFSQWLYVVTPSALRLLGILILALLAIRLLRSRTNVMIKPATSQSRAAQLREQQTRAIAGILYSVGVKVVWALAILIALPEFGVSVLPVVVVIGLAVLGLGLGARNLVQDTIAGLQIVIEDQYAVGDTIQTGQATGKVEHLTLRRTVLRDVRGAVITVANGDIRAVGNLSRDWSQAFIDISVAAEEPIERVVQCLEGASATLRSDPSWSQALIDGPRVLGVQAYGRSGPTLRLQVRTTPMRQEEISRELRRRIQMEFQRQGILLSSVQEFEQASVFTQPEEETQA